MWDTLFWIYLVILVFLANHEIDSAYQKEWELFRLPGGINLFLLLHFPLLFFFMWGLVLVYQERKAGLVISLLLCLIGIGALAIHTYFIKKGNRQFTTPMSQFILWATALFSVIGGVLTIGLILK